MGFRRWSADSHHKVQVTWKRFLDSKVHGANMGPTWVLSAPDGSHVGPWTLLSGFPCHDVIPMKGLISLTVLTHVFLTSSVWAVVFTFYFIPLILTILLTHNFITSMNHFHYANLWDFFILRDHARWLRQLSIQTGKVKVPYCPTLMVIDHCTTPY